MVYTCALSTMISNIPLTVQSVSFGEMIGEAIPLSTSGLYTRPRGQANSHTCIHMHKPHTHAQTQMKKHSNRDNELHDHSEMGRYLSW